MLPRAVVVPVVVHIPIVVVVLGPIRDGIVAMPAMILMPAVVVAVPVPDADVSKIDCDSRTGRRWHRNGYR
jgi:hypothetical protein